MEQVDECCLNDLFRVDVSLMLTDHGVFKTTSHVAVPLKTVTVPVASQFLAFLLLVHVWSKGCYLRWRWSSSKCPPYAPPIPPPPMSACFWLFGLIFVVP